MNKMNFKKYKRIKIAEMHTWSPEDKLNTARKLINAGVSISKPDLDNGSPKIGDMIARNPKNHFDMWLVEKNYAKENFEEIK